MTWERPSLSALVSRAVSDMQTRISGATTLLRRSRLKDLAKVQAGANHLLYGYLEYQAKQQFIVTADEIGLKSHGIEWGIDRGDPVASTGNVVFTGSSGTIPADTELQSSDGQTYIVDEDVTLVGGTATGSVTAYTAGTDGDQDVDTPLTFVSPIPGIDSIATVGSGGLEGGEDIEDVDIWRNRQLARKRNPPHGGAEHDYLTWMLEVDGVTRAWVFAEYLGRGTIGCAFVRDEEDPIVPTSSEIATVREYIVSHTDEATGKTVGIPVTAEPGLYMIPVAIKPIDLIISIYPNTSAIREAITDIIDDAWVTYGGPGETVYLSQLQKAIAATANLEYFKIDNPTTDITAAQTEVHIPGTYTFQDY